MKTGTSPSPLINLVHLKMMPILHQLHMEERLLRTSSHNWCIVNDATIGPTIVMGVSGKPSELLEIGAVLNDRIPVIRRFTGGGTVIVDQGTIFVTFICNKNAIHGLQPYPRDIMSWSSLLYKQVFQGIGTFDLRETDYVFGDHKFGGNAQSITKNRWVHHTSFLWDYEEANMSYLKLPQRAPEYRMRRCHLDFICRLKDYMTRSDFIHGTAEAVGNNFCVNQVAPPPGLIEASSDLHFTHISRTLSSGELMEGMPHTHPAFRGSMPQSMEKHG